MQWFDKIGERLARRVTYSSSRRGALARVGKALVGAAFIMPVLPIARAAPPRAEGDGDGGVVPGGAVLLLPPPHATAARRIAESPMKRMDSIL